MHRPGVTIGITVTLATIMTAACTTKPPTIDFSTLQPVDCPGEPVPTELRVTCHQYPRDGNNLAVAVLHSDEATAAPVLLLHGGPGGRAVAERHHWIAPRSPILAHHDMILVDQRGSGWSEPSLDCPEVDYPVGSLHNAYRECRSRLVAKGIDLTSYRVADIVADLNALRLSIGIDHWNLYAISFGTLVALGLLQANDGTIAAAVLDSPLPPRIAAYDRLPQGAGTAIDRALSRCIETNHCPKYLAHQLDDLLTQLEETPIAVTTLSGATRPLDNVALARLLLEALAHPSGPSTLPKAVSMAVAGRFAEAVASLDALATKGRTVGDTLSEGAQLSSECADVLPHDIADGPVATRPLLRALAGLETEVRSLCSIWGVPPAPVTKGPAPPPNSEVLILSGHLDPITPTAWARSLVADLNNATLVESDSWSHAPSLSDPCASELVARFFEGFRPKPGLASC